MTRNDVWAAVISAIVSLIVIGVAELRHRRRNAKRIKDLKANLDRRTP